MNAGDSAPSEAQINEWIRDLRGERDRAFLAAEEAIEERDANRKLADMLADKVETLRQMIIDICEEEGLEPPNLAEFDILTILAAFGEVKG